MVSHSLFKRYGGTGSVLAVGKPPVIVRYNDTISFGKRYEGIDRVNRCGFVTLFKFLMIIVLNLLNLPHLY